MEVDSDEDEEEAKPQRGKKAKAVKRKMWFSIFLKLEYQAATLLFKSAVVSDSN